MSAWPPSDDAETELHWQSAAAERIADDDLVTASAALFEKKAILMLNSKA